MLKLVFLITFITLALPAIADINLNRVHPDETVEYTYNERFSTKNALNRLSQIRLALESFRELTEAVEEKVSEEEMHIIGNTGWDVQNLGFRNWPQIIEGTLYKNDYIIKKLQYELAEERVKSGKLEASSLEKAEKELKQSEQQFLKFWNSFGLAD